MVWLVSLLLEGHTFQVKGKGIKGREQKQFSVSSMISNILVVKTGNAETGEECMQKRQENQKQLYFYDIFSQ